MIMFTKSHSVYLPCFIVVQVLHIFLFLDKKMYRYISILTSFLLNEAVEGTPNPALVLGGYLSLYVVWGIDFLPPTTLMKPLLGVPLGIHLVLITLSYLIWSLFKQEWMLRFALGVCLCMDSFLLVFVCKVKDWLMWLVIFAMLFLSSHVGACDWKSNTQGLTEQASHSILAFICIKYTFCV